MQQESAECTTNWATMINNRGDRKIARLSQKPQNYMNIAMSEVKIDHTNIQRAEICKLSVY